jgi:2-polyprenyl-3-methyl-5-hydroxy-6-metoxy-1,4-benzoquinol methylase
VDFAPSRTPPKPLAFWIELKSNGDATLLTLEKTLVCRKCQSTNLRRQTAAIVCEECGCSHPLTQHILTDYRLDQVNISDQSHTRHKYQSSLIAKSYMERYASPRRILDCCDAFVARRERLVIKFMLSQISTEGDAVLDLPAGTGKLGPVFAKFPFHVVAADISKEMLQTGERQWSGTPHFVGFVQTDVCRTGFRDKSFDCVICLRLMHRVSDEIATEALHELSRIAKKYLIVSTSLQRLCVAAVLGRRRRGPPRKLDRWNNCLSSFGEVQSQRLVSRTMSSEIISLIRLPFAERDL